jgi:hypothetical protein
MAGAFSFIYRCEVSYLCLCQEFVPHIVPTLQEPIRERVTGCYPPCRVFFLEWLQPLGLVLELTPVTLYSFSYYPVYPLSISYNQTHLYDIIVQDSGQ